MFDHGETLLDPVETQFVPVGPRFFLAAVAVTQGTHYENLPMQYTEKIFNSENGKFHWKIYDIFNIFAQNIDCGKTLNRLAEAVLTSTHILCFGSKIRKISIHLHTPVLLYKSWV